MFAYLIKSFFSSAFLCASTNQFQVMVAELVSVPCMNILASAIFQYPADTVSTKPRNLIKQPHTFIMQTHARHREVLTSRHLQNTHTRTQQQKKYEAAMIII